MQQMRISLLAIILLIVVSTISYGQQSSFDSKKDFLAVNIDSTVSPSVDFYQYANGGWIKKNPIPQDSRRWGPFWVFQEEMNIRLRNIIESMSAKNYPKGSIEQKIVDFWTTAMDSVKANQLGLQPLQSSLEKISFIKTINDLFDVIAEVFWRRNLQIPYFNYVTGNDFIITMGGLTMPESSLYLDSNQRSLKVRAAFQNYLFKTFLRLDKDSVKAKTNAEQEFELETRLAKAHSSRAEKKMKLSELSALTPNINWHRYLQKIGINDLDSIFVDPPVFFKILNDELSNTPIDAWKNYLRFKFVSIYSPFLDDSAFNNLAEYRQSFTGTSRPQPRWKRVLGRESSVFGDALTQLYVREYFDEKIKQRYTTIAEEIRTAFIERIKRLDWMSDSTKKGALDKIRKMDFKIGYPDKWRDYSDLIIDRDAWVLNEMRAMERISSNNIKGLKQPIDKSSWVINANMMDAAYQFDKNRIILAPGTFAFTGMRDEDLDDSFVYGYSGAIIGHEISHGFDRGRIGYDGDGNEKNWWTSDDLTEYFERTNAIIKQYDEFGHDNIDYGKNGQKENMADLTGLLLAIDAFKKTNAYKENKTIGGFTPMQRFFIGYAYRWMGELTKTEEASYIRTEGRGLPRERVNAPVVNTDEFYEAFNIKPGDKMYRPEHLRVKIW